MLEPRVFLSKVLAAMMVVGAGTVCGQDYPNRPIRLVTSALGGGNDITARLIAQWLTAPLGQQVIVENRTSLLSTETVARSQPDGYTLLFAGASFTVLPLLRENNKPYDPLRDFAPIAIIDTSPYMVVVHPSVPVKSIKALIDLARAKPGMLNYGSALGGAQQLAAELFKAMAGVNIVPITYKGAGPALNDLLGGQVHLMFTTTASAAPHVKSGKLRALAVTSSKPSALAPDLPTVTASGLPGYEFLSIDSMLAPAKTPAAIINRLNQELVRVLNRAEVKEKFLSFAAEAAPSSPEELAAYVKADTARLGKVIKDAGIRAD